MRRLQLLLAALSLVASPAPPSRIYPIEPQTLRRLIAETPYIVKAKVTAPDSRSPGRDFKLNNPRRMVTEDVVLVIEEVVKGKLDEEKISEALGVPE